MLISGLPQSRYVLKNRDTGDVLFVVVFTLVPKEDVEENDLVGKNGKKAKTNDAYEPKDDDLD